MTAEEMLKEARKRGEVNNLQPLALGNIPAIETLYSEPVVDEADNRAIARTQIYRALRKANPRIDKQLAKDMAYDLVQEAVENLKAQ